MNRLIIKYQMMIVASAGNFRSEFSLKTKIFQYSALFAPQMPVIVADDIDITIDKPHALSLSGPEVTLFAPYQINCAPLSTLSQI